jgi:hypothetical protein
MHRFGRSVVVTGVVVAAVWTAALAAVVLRFEKAEWSGAGVDDGDEE